MKMNRILNILIALTVVILVCLLCFDQYNDLQREKISDLAQLEVSRNRIPTDENSINIITDNVVIQDEEDVILSFESFVKGYKRTSYHIGETSVEYRFSRSLVAGGNDIYLLNFRMRAEEGAAKINVKFGTEQTQYLTTEWRDYYIPCTKGEIKNIKWSLLTDYQRIYLTDVKVYRYNPLNINYSDLKNGSFAILGLEEYSVPENEGLGVGKSMDVTGDGGYLYSVGEGMLTVSKIGSDGTEVVSTLGGIGNVRHIEQRDDSLLAVASRETGVYLINIEDKANPYTVNYYDSLEVANDICFSGNYMFVAGRYFGVEIVDISDPVNPVYVTRIVNEKECFRCVVEGSYLFVSCGAARDVEIYDISSMDEPVLVSTVAVDGRCAEAFVENSVLYVVSGYNQDENAAEVGDVGYGTGNGLAIFDISDIKRPRWCSTIRTEGSLYGNGYDDWSVQVSGGYAYFTNSFGGLYIYDVNNIEAPQAVAHITVPIYSESEAYVDLSENTREVYPFDATKHIVSPVMGIYVDEGNVFFACAYSDVYRYNFHGAKPVVDAAQSGTFTFTEKKTTEEEYEIFLDEYDVYAIAKLSGDYYIAGTAKGISLLDKTLAVVAEFETENPVKDIKVTENGFIVTAEKNGVAVYRCDNNQINRTGFVLSLAENCNVSSIGLTGDDNYAIVQSSWTKYEAVDLRDKYNPSLVTSVISREGGYISMDDAVSPGTMYYRNIVSGNVDGAVGIGGGNNMIWLESRNGSLKVKNAYSNRFASEINGNAALKSGSEILSLYNNGYVTYNPLSADDTQLSKLTRYTASGVLMKGKANIEGDIMVVCNAQSGRIHVINIENLKKPYNKAYYEIENSPGIALIEEDFVLVPVRHGGIIKIALG